MIVVVVLAILSKKQQAPESRRFGFMFLVWCRLKMHGWCVLQRRKKEGAVFFFLPGPLSRISQKRASAISRSKLPHSILWSAIVIAKSYLIQFFRVMMDLVSVHLSDTWTILEPVWTKKWQDDKADMRWDIWKKVKKANRVHRGPSDQKMLLRDFCNLSEISLRSQYYLLSIRGIWTSERGCPYTVPAERVIGWFRVLSKNNDYCL